MSVVDDDLLLAAVSRGDSSAFWPLWQKYAHRLFTVCLREMRGNRADAEDALGQTMLKALEKLPLFGSELRCAEAWLIRLARNLCRDLIRQRLRTDAAAEEFRRSCRNDGDDGRDDREEIDPEALIAALPAPLREIVLLRLVQRLPYKDIASQLRLTSAAARKRVQSARQTMQQLAQNEVTACRHGRRRTEIAPFENRTNRAHQKIATLRAYIKEHPSGWKKLITLGDLLYVTGSLEEAADCYKHALDKHPWLDEVSARLEEVTRQIHNDAHPRLQDERNEP